MTEQFDLIVIGGGPGGYVAAIRGAQYGLRTALVEERQVGGTCLNRGCIPTKALMHASQLYREVLESEELGIFAEGLYYNLPQLYKRKDAVVSELRDGVTFLLEANGVACYSGRGRITGANQVQVTGACSEEHPLELEGKHILLATGAAPVRPPIPGVQLPGVITSDELLDGEPIDYKSLVVIGGGVVGVEIASVYRNLGCEVTIVEAAERILPNMDREISQNLTMILKKRGITVCTGTTVQEISQCEDGLSVRHSSKKGEEAALGEAVLLAIGRRANIEGLMCAGQRLDTDHKGILVNERFETSVSGVYAIGDCVSGSVQLAHVASAQATNAVAMMAGREAELDLSVVPGCIYTSPEIATVGITADEAKGLGLGVKTSKYIMSGNGKSIIDRQERGFVKLVFDGETEVLLGAQLMCGRATDLIGELSAAMAGGLTAKELSAVIHPHPTFSEGVGEAVESLFGRAVHIAPKGKAK